MFEASLGQLGEGGMVAAILTIVLCKEAFHTETPWINLTLRLESSGGMHVIHFFGACDTLAVLNCGWPHFKLHQHCQ